MTDKPSAYRDAGVDIDAKYQAVRGSRDAIRATFTAGVVGDVGQFGGIFDLAAAGAEGGLLVASIDGVGTKVDVAQRAGAVGSIGQDLVNHCVNDILVQGARPLFFLDYIAVARMVPAEVQQIITGIATACRENRCALLGGETAEMPGVYRDGAVDVAGVIIGAVDRARVLDGQRIAVGDRILALPSSGLHTNGYSLARRVVFDQLGLSLDDAPDRLGGETVGAALLAVHRSYLDAVAPLLDRELVHGLAHITGGGLPDNLPRVLPAGTAARIDAAAMPRPPIFDLLVEGGGVDRDEAYRVFNMGFGMVIVVGAGDEERVRDDLRERGHEVHAVGAIVAGDRDVVIS
jgi:phosphoribosylformylglycinamidine cyclo-ligase